jgi:hypothetical protein
MDEGALAPDLGLLLYVRPLHELAERVQAFAAFDGEELTTTAGRLRALASPAGAFVRCASPVRGLALLGAARRLMRPALGDGLAANNAWGAGHDDLRKWRQ